MFDANSSEWDGCRHRYVLPDEQPEIMRRTVEVRGV